LEAERIVARAEVLKEKSFYLQSLKLFKKAFLGYKQINDLDGMSYCMLSLGNINRIVGNFNLATKSYTDAIKLAGRLRDTVLAADARVGLGLSLRAQGRWREAIKHISTSRRIYKEKNDREGLAFTFWAEAGALRVKGQIRKAIKTFKASLEIFRTLKHKPGIGFSLCGLGGTSRVAGKISDSLMYYTRANKLFTALKDTFGIAYSHCGMGNAYRMTGDYKRALTHFKKAVRQYKKIGDMVSYSYTVWSLGTTYKMMGSYKKARDCFNKSMLIFKKTKDPRGIIYFMLGLGELDFLEGRKGRALRRLQAALAEAGRYRFAVEKCHATVIISYIRGKLFDRCYNKLGLKNLFQGLPFNTP